MMRTAVLMPRGLCLVLACEVVPDNALEMVPDNASCVRSFISMQVMICLECFECLLNQCDWQQEHSSQELLFCLCVTLYILLKYASATIRSCTQKLLLVQATLPVISISNRDLSCCATSSVSI